LEINFAVQRQDLNSVDLVLQMYEQTIKVMNCVKSMIIMR